MRYSQFLSQRTPAWLNLLRIGAPVAILAVGLLAQGAEAASEAALLGAWLCGLLALVVAVSPAAQTQRVLGDNALALLGAAAFAAWGAYTAAARGGPLTHPTWAEFALAPGTPSVAPYRTWEGLAAFAAPVAAFGLGALAVAGARGRDGVAKAVCLMALGLAMLALLQFLMRAGAGAPNRLSLGLASANVAATAFAALGCVAFTQTWRQLRGRDDDGGRGFLAVLRAPWPAAAFVLCVAAIMLTASRGGIASALLGFALLAVLLLGGARRPVGWPAVALVLAGAGLAAVGADQVLRRLAWLDAAAPLRSVIVETHWAVFLDRPWFGHGLNSFHDLNSHWMSEAGFAALSRTGSAHNIYVQLLEEAGVIGAVAMGVAATGVVWRLARLALAHGRGADWAAAGLAIAVVVAVHGWVDFALQTPAIAALAAFVLGAFSQAPAPVLPMPEESAPGGAAVLVKGLAAACAGLGAFGAAHVADAAAGAASAEGAISRIAALQSPRARATAADLALVGLLARPSQPVRWHGGAAAAAAWLEATAAEGVQPPAARMARLARSAAWTQTALQQAPLQPRAWLHLGMLAAGGAPAPCTPAGCVARSFAAAPVAGAPFGCRRLGFAHTVGALTGPDDEAVRMAARLAPTPRAAAQCLAFLTPRERYKLLLHREAARTR